MRIDRWLTKKYFSSFLGKSSLPVVKIWYEKYMKAMTYSLFDEKFLMNYFLS